MFAAIRFPAVMTEFESQVELELDDPELTKPSYRSQGTVTEGVGRRECTIEAQD